MKPPEDWPDASKVEMLDPIDQALNHVFVQAIKDNNGNDDILEVLTTLWINVADNIKPYLWNDINTSPEARGLTANVYSKFPVVVVVDEDCPIKPNNNGCSVILQAQYDTEFKTFSLEYSNATDQTYMDITPYVTHWRYAYQAIPHQVEEGTV